MLMQRVLPLVDLPMSEKAGILADIVAVGQSDDSNAT